MVKVLVLGIVVFLPFFYQIDLYAQNTFDGPEFDYENQVYHVYKEFGSRLIADGEWEGLAQDRNVESYSIQTNDTLWGISKIYFGSGYYWAKIWALNGEITNPHEIVPNKELRFYPGTLDQEPHLELANKLDQEPHLELANKKEKLSPKELRELIPPPKKKITPVLRLLPPSLPSSLVRRRIGQADVQLSISLIATPERPALSYQLTDYISESTQGSLGKIIETELGGKTARPGQYVYIKTEKAQIGKEYLVLSKVAELSGSNMIEVQGRVRLLEEANREGDIYRALVTYSVSPIFVGSYIAEGEIQVYTMQLDGSLVSSSQGKILGGRYDNNRKIFGRGGIVFIDLGAKSGIETGTLLPIILNQKSRNSESRVDRVIKRIGLLKVLRLGERHSTAVILQSSEDIRTGDLVGGFEQKKNQVEGGKTIKTEQDELLLDSLDEVDSQKSVSDQEEQDDFGSDHIEEKKEEVKEEIKEEIKEEFKEEIKEEFKEEIKEEFKEEDEEATEDDFEDTNEDDLEDANEDDLEDANEDDLFE